MTDSKNPPRGDILEDLLDAVSEMTRRATAKPGASPEWTVAYAKAAHELAEAYRAICAPYARLPMVKDCQ